MSEDTKKSKANILPVAVFGWLIPGMGHVWLGQVKRGLIIFIALNAMFWSGIAIGGVMTFDKVYEKWWFYAQMLCGANSVVSWYRAENVYKQLSVDPDVVRVAGYELEMRRDMGFPVDTSRVITPSPTGRPDDLQMMVDKKLAEEGIALVRPVDEIARAFTGIAGLMNLLCVFDAIMLAIAGRVATDADTKKEAQA